MLSGNSHMLNEEALLMLWHSDVKRHTGLEKLVVVVCIARYSGKNIQMMLIYQAKHGGQPSCLSLCGKYTFASITLTI
jgi:hypothetical protein